MTVLGASLEQVGLLAAYVAGGAVAGLAVQAVASRPMKALARKSGRAGTPIVAGLRGMPAWWLAIAAGLLRLRAQPLTPGADALFSRLLLAIGGVTVTVAAARIAVGLVREYVQSPDGPLPSTSIFVNLTRIGVIALGALLVLNALGISVTPVLTALGVGGLAVALALQDTLSNLFAGLQLLASRQIHPGDHLTLDSGQEGVVEDVTWRYTTLLAQGGNLVVVPNAKLAQAIVTNHALPEQPLGVPVEFAVAYGSDLEEVERVASQVAAAVVADLAPTLADYEPIVRFRALEDSGIGVTAILRSPTYADQFAIRSEFIKRLVSAFAEHGIEIPYPHLVVVK
ncbi:MAG: mechanosensitive ion channel family protein [Anaerosomatales bacterium]|nr:mechanosensitive ion channel family protein [Coriobacteriia bacterium]MDI6691891.1 mechanosensitive ion channel family protein [Anaerosomatales bacterium]